MTEVRRSTASVSGAEFELSTVGSGPPLLFLHGEDGLLFAEPFLEALAGHHEVVAPRHPGWGGSPRSGRFRSIDDLAYLYLDLLDTFSEPVPVVGASFGGWLALEMATKCCTGISHLALAAPLGLRVADDPATRVFLDIYASSQVEVERALYGDDGAHRPDLSLLTDDQFLYLAQAQEGFARYAWEPYLHNPCLADRLHRVTVPTLLVGGDADGLVLVDRYLDAFAERIAGSTEIVTLPGVGHRVEEQAPTDLAEQIAKFVGHAA